MPIIVIMLIIVAGAVAVALMPRQEAQACRHMGMFFSIAAFCTSFVLPAQFNATSANIQFEVNYPWIAALGANFHLGIDGISLWLVMLTTFLTPIVLLSSYSGINERVKEFVVALLVLELAMIGALVALDVLLFYIFWEIMLVPMYLMIGVWGHENKIYASLKFFIYTVVGSLLMLVAIIYMYVTHGQATGTYTFDYMVLREMIWGHQAEMWLFAAFALAFAIKVPLFPLHTWLPDAHTQAPTGGSIILAGVLLKMGTYGLIRYALPLFPFAAASYAPLISTLAVVGIIYGALVAYTQKDAKRLIAYSSVSHLGFVTLGMLAMNEPGLSGSIYQMLNHGISTGGLFLAIGVLYDRRHTHLLSEFGGLWKRMPVFAGLFMIVLLSSAGLPGLNGFVGEFMILIGSFTHKVIAEGETLWLIYSPFKATVFGPRFLTFLAATGVVAGAVYLLHLFQELMFGPVTNKRNETLSDLSWREVFSFCPLIALIFIMGIYPKPFLKPMEPTVKSYISNYTRKFAAAEKHHGSEPVKWSTLARPKTNKAAALAQIERP